MMQQKTIQLKQGFVSELGSEFHFQPS